MIPAWHRHTPFSGLSFNGWSFKKQPWFIPFISVLIQINTDRMTWVESYSTCYLFYFIFNWKKITLQHCDGFYYIHHHESAISSVQFSLSAVFDSLWPHGLQHARLPCLSPTPRACSDSCSSSPWCHPTISSSAFNLCQCQGLFQWVSSSHQVAKVLELQLHSPSNEYSRLISFKMDWFDLLAVQGTLKSFLQQHSSKASILAVEIHTCQPS